MAWDMRVFAGVRGGDLAPLHLHTAAILSAADSCEEDDRRRRRCAPSSCGGEGMGEGSGGCFVGGLAGGGDLSKRGGRREGG